MLNLSDAEKCFREMMNETDDSPYGRYRSWWYCYQAFSEAFAHPGTEDRDYLALSLAFYLASWGMYRGSSFLLQHDYKIHQIVVDYLLDGPIPKILWTSSRNQFDFYSQSSNVNMLVDVCTKLQTLYETNDPEASVTAALATKVLMGALGCTPAYDQYVTESIKESELIDTQIDGDGAFGLVRQSISEISKFYIANAQVFQGVTTKPQGFYYPPMKIMDMALWKMSFRKREAQKILELPSPKNEGKAKVWRTKEEDEIVLDWLQGDGFAYSEFFEDAVLVPVEKNPQYQKRKRSTNIPIKQKYQDLYASFADFFSSSGKPIIRNTMPDEN